METEIMEEKLKGVKEKSVSKFELRAEDKTLESAKENFLTFMESVWPTVANYYFEVEKEILSSIKKGNPKKVKFFEKEENQIIRKKSSIYFLNKEKKGPELKPQLSLTEETVSSSSTVSTYDCSAALKKQKLHQVSEAPKPVKSRKKIVETKDADGNVVWDVVEAISCPTFPSTAEDNRVENSAPIAVHHDPGLLYTDSPESIPPEIRQAIVDSEAQVRQTLSTCFGKISKAFTNSYPKIRLIINKAYPQIHHTVSCSYPNIQYTINNSYDKVQGTVRSAYPKIRKTVTGSYPKRQTISTCYRRVRQSQMKIPNNNKCDSTMSSNKLADANFDLMSRLTAANAEISQALHNTSKKVSIALGTANLEILQALKNSSNKVSKSLIKANSEILESLAMANDDLRKSLAMICNEAARDLEAIKIQLSKVILDLHPNVWHVILNTYENLQQALEHSHVEILETLAAVSSEVCEQISNAHGKYSEVKVTVNYELSLALAKANSQVLQVLIAANSKVSDVLERNTEKVNQIATSGKLGPTNLELLESRVWRAIEKGEADVWKTSENASFTIESAVESTDSRLWKVADEADNNLRKAVQGVENKLVVSIGSSEWKLKSCAERLETLVTECVGMFVDTAWQSVSCYISECGRGRFSKTHLRNNHESEEVNIPKAHSSSSVKVLLGCNNNGYYVGFPESEDDEDFDPSALLRLQPSEIPLEDDSSNQVTSKDVNAATGDTFAVEDEIKMQKNITSNGETVAVTNCSEAMDLAVEASSGRITSGESISSGNESLEKVISSYSELGMESKDQTDQTAPTNEYSETLPDCQFDAASLTSLTSLNELSQLQNIKDCENNNQTVELPGSEITKEEYKYISDSESQSSSEPDDTENKNFAKEPEAVSRLEEENIVQTEPDKIIDISESKNKGDHLAEIELQEEKAAGEAAATTVREVFCHSQAPPIEQLAASFQANLEKLQLSLSTDASSSIKANCPTTLEAQQLLQECQRAWNVITILYQSTNLGIAKTFDQKLSECSPSDDSPAITTEAQSRSEVDKQSENVCHDCIKTNNTSQYSDSISSSKPSWHADIVFENISWEAVVDSSRENLFADLDEEESLEFVNLSKRNSSIVLHDHPKPETLEIISCDPTPELSQVINDLPNDSTIYPIIPLAPTSNTTLTEPEIVIKSPTINEKIDLQEIPTKPEKDSPEIVTATISPPTFENSDFEEASTSSRNASPPASVITLPFTDDEQQVDVCPQTSFEDGSFISETPSYLSENLKEMISNFVELSAILFYKASIQSPVEAEQLPNFPQNLPLPFMSVERRPLHSAFQLLPPPTNSRSPLSHSIKSAIETQTLSTTITPSLNIVKRKKYHYLPNKIVAQKLWPVFRHFVPRSKLSHFKSRLKNFFPCFQNSYNKSAFRIHPIKRVRKCTNFQQ